MSQPQRQLDPMETGRSLAERLNPGVESALREICEAIFQRRPYGGLPAAINALNAALEVFDEQGITP